MQGNLTTADIQLIANLINDKYDGLTDHISNEIRMVKLTVQDNHKVSVEARDQARLTNGRVNGVENDLYGEYDKNKKIKPGHEGLIFDYDELVTKNKWLLWNWKYKATIMILAIALFIQESRSAILSFFNIKL